MPPRGGGRRSKRKNREDEGLKLIKKTKGIRIDVRIHIARYFSID